MEPASRPSFQPAGAGALLLSVTVLGVGGELFGLLLGRLPLGAANLARAGVVAFGMMFRAIAVMVILVAIAVSDARLALSAAVVYALAYTLELGVSLISYFGGAAR